MAKCDMATPDERARTSVLRMPGSLGERWFSAQGALTMDQTTAEDRLLDAADALFYDRGINAVGMDAIRAASGVSLKRSYQVFPSKERLIEAVLQRRDQAIRTELEAYTSARTTPTERVLAVFDYLFDWFSQPDFHGCAFINSFAELRATSESVV